MPRGFVQLEREVYERQSRIPCRSERSAVFHIEEYYGRETHGFLNLQVAAYGHEWLIRISTGPQSGLGNSTIHWHQQESKPLPLRNNRFLVRYAVPCHDPPVECAFLKHLLDC